MTRKALIATARLARRPVLATQTDERLVELVRAGFEPAFEAIVARYRVQLLRYVERLLPGGRAEDAVQQALVRAYDAILRDDAELDLRPWLYRIAHNTALNALRDRALQDVELPEGLGGADSPAHVFERQQGLRELLAAVEALPPAQRDAIVLRELEGRSYREIATELGVGDGSVRQLLNRARNALRAGATALTPIGLLARLPWVAPAEPVAELTAAAGLGAIGAKLAATAVLGGALVGGVAVAPSGQEERRAMPERPVADAAPSVATPRTEPKTVVVAAHPARRAANEQTAGSPGATPDRRPAPRHRRRGDGEDVAESAPQPVVERRSGHEDGRQDEPNHHGRGHSGPGDDAHEHGGEHQDSDNSGPSPGSPEEPQLEEDHGGPGSGSSGPSPSSGSGSGPSLSSGSGSSGPGGGDEASEEPGSSGSSGPGGGDEATQELDSSG